MTQDEIIEMAREAKLPNSDLYHGNLKTFTKLVAAKEREACAKLAETPVYGEQDDITMEAKDRVATAIRARGEKA